VRVVSRGVAAGCSSAQDDRTRRRPLPARSTKPETECNLARLDAMVEACLDSRDYVEGRRAFMNTPQPGIET
jgi:hypothetical protein